MQLQGKAWTVTLLSAVQCGHSFGGVIITAVADTIPERLSRLIYVDAAVLENGESMFSKVPENIADTRRRQAQASDDGLSMPVPTADDMGIKDTDKWELVERFLTPHPISSYESRLQLRHPPGNRLPCTYVACTNPGYQPLKWARDRVKNYDWKMLNISTGHCAMTSDPTLLSELLVQESGHETHAQIGETHA